MDPALTSHQDRVTGPSHFQRVDNVHNDRFQTLAIKQKRVQDGDLSEEGTGVDPMRAWEESPGHGTGGELDLGSLKEESNGVC